MILKRCKPRSFSAKTSSIIGFLGIIFDDPFSIIVRTKTKENIFYYVGETRSKTYGHHEIDVDDIIMRTIFGFRLDIDDIVINNDVTNILIVSNIRHKDTTKFN